VVLGEVVKKFPGTHAPQGGSHFFALEADTCRQQAEVKMVADYWRR